MSFETSAELSLTVDEGDLQNVKQQIESEIGTTAVGVTDGGSMSAQSAGGGGGGRGRRARRSMRLAETRTEHLEDAVFYLESIDDAVSEGGLGGGGGGLVTELFGVAGETAGDVAVETGDTVADAVSDVLTGTASTALGNSISSAITSSTLTVEPNPLPVEAPTGGTDGPIGGPLPIPDLPTLPVPELPELRAPESIPVEREPLPVEDTTLPVEDTTLPVRDTTLPVENVTLPVEDVGPISVTVNTRTVASQNGSGSNRGALQRAGDALDDVGARGADMIVPGDIPDSVGERLGKGGTPLGRPFETIGRGLDTINPLTSGGFRSGTGSSSSGNTQLDVSVTHSPTYRVDVDPRKLDQMVSDIVSEIESNVERDIDELEQEINDLRSNLDTLERDIRRSR